MHWLAGLLIILQFLYLPASPELTREANTFFGQGITLADAGSQSIFGGKITFQASSQPYENVKEVLVSFTPEGQETHLESMLIGRDGIAIYEISASQLSLAPFTRIEYHFEALLKNGTKIISPPYQIQYDDTRFDWQSQESGIFQVHWTTEEATFGQEIINVARSGLEQAQSLLSVDPPSPLRIYVYSSARALQEALMVTGESWVAGHASPDLGMILISIPSGPEKNLELQRQIPHEIMHLLQYQITGKNYRRQPMWLMEGMASLAELYPNPEYSRILADTTKGEELIPFANLCAAFPTDAGPAFRAYAQSESFVRFIHNTYGNTGLRKLMDQYQNGLGCSEAVNAAFGTSLGQLEYRWKQEVLGINAGELAMLKLSPYLLIGLLLFISASISFWSIRVVKNQ